MRKLAIALLDDDHGIGETAWTLLREALTEEGGNDDILDAVDAVDGRFFLPPFQINNDTD